MGGNTLSPYVTAYLDRQRMQGRMTKGTAVRASYRLHRFAASFGDRPISHLNRQAVERWLESIHHLSSGSRRLNLSDVGSFCRWLIREEVIRRDPTAEIRIPKPRSVPRALRKDQVAQLLAALPDERSTVIVALMLYCGLRCIEVSRARTEDYDPFAGTLLVTGKGGHQRMLPVPVEAAEILNCYLSKRSVAAGPLIRSYNEPWKGLTADTISAYMSKSMRAAGIKKARFDGVAAHALRHTAASDTLDHCGDLEAVREMLGHASLTTTQIYLRRANLDRLREAMSGRRYEPPPPSPAVPLRGPAGAGEDTPDSGRPTEGNTDYPATA
jgi:site-specific recombinase XerD